MLNRSRMVDALTSATEPWDVLIVGGGATGLGAALEAASRGHRTALVEAHDFGKGTSSRSTKLIHGGVRYLAMGQIGMVRQSLIERERLLRNAPGLVQPIDFILPSTSRLSQFVHYAGLRLYDVLASRWRQGRSRWLSRREVQGFLPTVRTERLCGGVRYTDAQFDDARLAIALAQTAAEQGAVLANRIEVMRLVTTHNRISGAIVRDQESGHEHALSARVVINATGVFAEQLLALDDSFTASSGSHRPHVVPSQGSHIVLDASFFPGRTALLIPKTDDGRVLFVIPWLNRVIVGTTDVRVDQVTIEPRPAEDEVSYLLEHAAKYLVRPPSYSDVLARFAGLRPLVGRLGSRLTSKLSREHDISVSPGGLITVIGGKWTTYRRMGEELIDRAEVTASLTRRRSVTALLPLMTGSGGSGSIAAKGPNLLHPRLPYASSDVIRAVRFEMARTVEDVLARRTRALFLDARAAEEAAPEVARLMRGELNQSPEWEAEQVTAFRSLAARY